MAKTKCKYCGDYFIAECNEQFCSDECVCEYEDSQSEHNDKGGTGHGDESHSDADPGL